VELGIFATMVVIKPDKKKDGLTDLVSIATTPESCNSQPAISEGQAVTSSGEVVTLGFEKDIDRLARNLISEARKKNK
jgi:hypothetical protein